MIILFKNKNTKIIFILKIGIFKYNLYHYQFGFLTVSNIFVYTIEIYSSAKYFNRSIYSKFYVELSYFK